MKQFGTLPFLRDPPPLSTNPPISEQFFHDSCVSLNFKKKNRTPNFRGKETMVTVDVLRKKEKKSESKKHF